MADPIDRPDYRNGRVVTIPKGVRESALRASIAPNSTSREEIR